MENVDFVSRRLLAEMLRIEESFTFDDEGILDEKKRLKREKIVAMIRK